MKPSRKIQRCPIRKIIVFSSNPGPFSQFWTCLPDLSIKQNIAMSSHGKKLTRTIPGISTFPIPWEKRTWCISPIFRCICSVSSSRVETCSSCQWNLISIASVVGGSAASSGCSGKNTANEVPNLVLQLSHFSNWIFFVIFCLFFYLNWSLVFFI